MVHTPHTLNVKFLREKFSEPPPKTSAKHKPIYSITRPNLRQPPHFGFTIVKLEAQAQPIHPQQTFLRVLGLVGISPILVF